MAKIIDIKIKMRREVLKRIVVGLFAVTVILGISQASYAQTPEEPSQSAAVEVGNKICPVSGEKIDEKMKATYEYNGKIYNFCCPMCIEEFKKDPEKYIKKIEEEKQVESAPKVEPSPATDAHQEHSHMQH